MASSTSNKYMEPPMVMVSKKINFKKKEIN